MNLREQALKETKQAVADAVNDDQFVIQAITNKEELDKQCSAMAARVREWYGLFMPELAHHVKDNEAFLQMLQQDPKHILNELAVKQSMGAKPSKEDLTIIKEYGKQVQHLFNLKAAVERYLEAVMERSFRNIAAVAGPYVGAKLIAEAGSLKRLATLPSTTIQLLGAEKALFRHLKTGAKPPKYGHIFAHPLVQAAKRKDSGKVARSVADKIALAARSDFFGKTFKGAELRQELEAAYGH